MTWVFLPGMDGTGDLLAPVLKEMPRGDVCVTARYPRTQVHDRSELFSIIWEVLPNFEDYVLVAESFSGPFALQAASRKPERLRALILVGTFAGSPMNGIQKLLAHAFSPLAMAMPLPRFLIRALLSGPDSTDDEVDLIRSTVRSVKRSVLASRCKMTLRANCTDLMSRINVPTLVIGAIHDRLIPRRMTERLCSEIHGARLEWLDAPHLVLFTKPRLAANVMQRFLSAIESK